MIAEEVIGRLLQQSETTPMPATGGAPPGHNRKLSKEQQDRIIAALEVARRESRQLARMVFLAHYVVLIVAIAAAWSQRDEAKFLIGILAGAGGVFVLLLGAFRRFWRDVAVYDVLCAILPGATSDEALKALQAFYVQSSEERRSK